MRRRLPERLALAGVLAAGVAAVTAVAQGPWVVAAAGANPPAPTAPLEPPPSPGIPFVSAAAMPAPPPAPPATGRGGLCPSGAIAGPACNAVTGGVSGAVGAVGNAIGDAAGSLAGDAAGGVAKAVTKWIADGATGLLGATLGFATSALDPGLTATTSCPGCVGATSGLGPYLQRMRGLAAACAVGFLLLSVVQATLRADPAVLGQALRQLAFAALLTVVLVWGTRLLMEVADQMTTYVIGDSLQADASTFIQNLGTGYGTAIDNGSVSLFLIALSALLTVLVGFLLWIEFAIRTAIIELAVLFFPLLLAAAVWAPAARAARRVADVLVTAIFSKFVMLVTLGLAASLFAQASGPLVIGIGQFAVGVVLLLLTVLAPIALLSFVSHAPEAVGAYAATHRGGGAAAMGSAQRQATRLAGAPAGGGAGAGAGTAAAGGASTTPVLTGADRTVSTAGGGGSGGGGGGGRPTAPPTAPSGAGSGAAGPPGEQPAAVMGMRAGAPATGGAA